MMKKMISKVRQAAAERRSRRFMEFLRGFQTPTSILDLGGSAEMWHRWGVSEKDCLSITLVNSHHVDTTHRYEEMLGDFMKSRIEDVMNLGADDYARYDIIFSNSMFEHLCSKEDQARLASAIIDSEKPYFVQVPNKYCLVDPHFPHPLAPFFSAWPRQIQARMLTLHRLGSGSRSSDYVSALNRLSCYSPISRRDLRNLFPDANIDIEWNFGLPISLIASSKKFK